MTKCNASVDGGSAAYWTELAEAWRLIRNAESAAAAANAAPLYIAGGYDEDGEVVPLENIQPFDDLDDAVRHVEANRLASSICAATGRRWK